MKLNFETVKDVVSSYSDQIADTTMYAGRQLIELGSDSMTHASPYVNLLAEKAQLAWENFLPFLKAFYEFSKSHLGIASYLLLGAIICMKAASVQSDQGNRVAAVGLFALGITAAVASGVFLMGSGLLPSGRNLV